MQLLIDLLSAYAYTQTEASQTLITPSTSYCGH